MPDISEKDSAGRVPRAEDLPRWRVRVLPASDSPGAVPSPHSSARQYRCTSPQQKDVLPDPRAGVTPSLPANGLRRIAASRIQIVIGLAFVPLRFAAAAWEGLRAGINL